MTTTGCRDGIGRTTAILCMGAALAAAEFAVAPAPQGDDAAGGRGQPFATLAAALARSSSGDTVWLARGGLYREQPVAIPAGVAVKAAPGSGPPPMITAAVAVSGWKPSPRNPRVLCASVPQPVLELYVDGRFQAVARHPNTGWMRSGTGTTADALASPDLAQVQRPAGSWRGAQVRWRRWSWWWETRPIASDDGAVLRLGPENRFHDPMTGVGSAFCVDNALDLLDAPGEWFWDPAAKQLHLMPPAGADPKRMLVEAVGTEAGWTARDLVCEGVGFIRCAGTALTVNGRSRIAGCLFQDLGGTALRGAWDAAGSMVSGCTFRDVRNVGIQWNENDRAGGGTVFEGNRFERIGMQPGYGGSGSWHASGIVVAAGNAVAVRGNTMVDVGYAGIILGASGTVVERNILVRCMSTLNDGAAIYANASRSRVHENIVLDTVGNLETSHFWYPLGHGIWMEFLSEFRDQSLVGNTVYGSGGNGIFLTNNYHCEVRGNVLCGSRLGQLLLGGPGRKAPQDHTVADNILAAQTPSRRIPRPEQIPSDWAANDQPRGLTYEDGIDYGRMAGTVFVLSPGVPAMRGDRTSWLDAAGRIGELRWADPSPRQLRGASLLLVNDTAEDRVVDPPGGGWAGIDGKPVGKGVALKPFRSAVVVRDGREDGLPPYICASGTDWRAEPKEAGRRKPGARR